MDMELVPDAKLFKYSLFHGELKTGERKRAEMEEQLNAGVLRPVFS